MHFPKALIHVFLCALCLFLSACNSTSKQDSKATTTKTVSSSSLAPDSSADSIRIAVTGQVPQPGYYTVSTNANIATVLVQAGWTPYFAKDKYENSPSIWIKRLGEGTQETWILPMSELYDDKWMDFELQNGDIINVMIILF